MTERDWARTEIKTTPGDNRIAMQKYKTLRNRVTRQVKTEVRSENEKRIEDAKSESEYSLTNSYCINL